MPTNDFFLDFGSNADKLGAKLARDLSSAREEIKGLETDLDGLNEKLTTTASRMVTIARARKGQTPEPRQQAPSQAGGRGGGGAGDGGQSFKNLVGDINEYNTSLAEMVAKITVVVDSLSPITKQIEKDRRKVAKTRAGQKSYQTRLDNGDGPDEQGRVTAKGSATNPASIKDTGAKNKPVEVRIASTSQGLIDEAAFKRVVSALEKNTEATKANTASMRAGGAGATGGGRVAAGGVAAGTLRNQLGKRQQLAALKQELTRTRSGGEFDAQAFATAAGGRKRLVERGERMGHTGPDWEAQLVKTIGQLEKDLKGVPRAKNLRQQLGGGAAAAAQSEEGLTEEQRKLLTATADRIQAGIDAAEEELAGLRQEQAAEKLTRKEKKALRQTEAAAVKEAAQAAKGDPGLSSQQRANVADHLAVAGDEDVLRKQLKGRLVEIAQSIKGEGGDLGFDNPKNTKLTNEKLIQGILKGSAQIQAAGKTFHDLTTNKQADSISRDAMRVAGKLREERKISPTEAQAYELRKQHRQSGGEDEPFKGAQQFGGDFQEGQARKWVMAAQATINERNNVRLPTAAIDAALENMSRGRNVYSDKIKFSGTGEDVKETKAALGQIRRATDAIDKMVDEFDELPGAIAKAEKAVQELTKDYETLGASANMKNADRQAQLRKQISTSIQNEAIRSGQIDDIRAHGKGTKTVEFTEQNAAQLKDLNAAIKAEAAARRDLRKRIVKETTDPDTIDMNERLKNQISRSLQKGKVLESQAANLRGVRAGTVTTSTGLNEKQQAALKILTDKQLAEAAARSEAETELRKLTEGSRRTQGVAKELQTAESKLAQLRAKQVAMAESDEGGFVGGLSASQKYRTGRSARDAHRATLDTKEAREAREDAAQKAFARMEENQASLMGLGGVLGGPRTKQRATKGEREALYGFPGLGQVTRPGARQGQLRFTDQASPVGDPKKLEEINKSLASYVAVQKKLGELNKAEVKDVEQIAKLKKEALNDLQRMINAYDEMGLQDKLGIGARRAYVTDDQQLGYRSDVGAINNTPRMSKKRIAGESDDDYASRMEAQKLQAAANRKAKADAQKALKAAETQTEAAAISTKAAETDVQAAKVKNEAANKGAAAAARATTAPAAAPGAPVVPGMPGATGRNKDQEARNAARTGTNQATVLGQLSAATRKQIKELEALKAADASATVIAEKQIRVYAAMSNELRALKLNTSAVRQSFQTVSAGAGVPVTHGEINNISRSANMRGLIASQSKGMGNEAENTRDLIAKKLFGDHGFWSRIANSTGTFVIRNFSAGLVFGLTAALSDVTRQAIVTESTFIRVSQALEATGRSSGNLRTQLQQVSTDYGVALEDVYETAAGLTGLFDDIDDIAGATRIAAQLQIISNGALNATEAMGALASITSAFGELSGDEGLEHIADVLTTIQNRLGVNIEVTAEGVGRLAGLAQQIGLTFEETAVYVGEIAKKTNQTGAAAGEQFSRIIAVMQTGRGQKALTENLGDKGIGTALSGGDYATSLKILMENYGELTKVQQTNIAVTLGGQRQAASLAALLKDGAGALDTVRAATYSKGEADKRAAAISKTLNVEVAKLQSNFVNLGSNLIRTGILGFFAALFVGVNRTLGALNTFLSTINDIAESNPFVSFMTKAAVATIGLALAIKVLKASFAGLKAYMKSDSAGGAALRSLAGPIVTTATDANGAQLSSKERLRQGISNQATNARNRIQAVPAFAPGLFNNAGQRAGSLGQSLRNQQASLMARSAMQGAGARGFPAAFGATAAGAAAKGLNATSSALTRVGQSATIANVAMIALTIALTAAVMEMFAASQRAKDVQNAYESVFTERGNESAAKKAESYVGPATDFVRKNQDELQGVGGFFRGMGSGITGLFQGRGLGETSARNAGDIDDKVWNDISKPVMDGFKKFQDISKNQFSSIASVNDAASETQKEIAKKAGEIAGDDSLSAEQKATALSALEKDKKAVEDLTANMILDMQGLANLDQWTGSQIDEVMGVLSIFASSPSAGQNYSAQIQQLMESVNVGGKGSSLGDDWKALAAANTSTADLLTNQLNITDVAIQNASAVLSSKLDSGNEDEIAAASDRLKGLIQQGEQLKRAILDSVISSATEAATAMRNTGDYAGAQAALDAAAADIRARVETSKTNRRDKGYNDLLNSAGAPGSVPRRKVDEGAILTPEEEQRYLNTAATTGQSALDVGAVGKTQTLRAAARNTRNAIELAKLQEEIAQIRLDGLRASLAAGTGATAEQVEDAEQAVIDATRSKLDTQQGVKAGKYAATSAGILNSVSKAQNDEAGAFQALAYARAQYGTNSEQYQSALAAARSASQGTQQAIEDQLAAQRETELAMMAPADAVGRAQKTLSNARAAQANAARFGQSSVQYQSATQAVIEAQRGVDTAIFEIADANSNLALVMAQAAGKTVDVARMKLEQAQVELQRARAKSGGQVTALTINAEAGVKQAQADLRDATLQDQLDTIDFQKNMDQITSRGAISMLTDLLNMKDLTEQQRRDILLRIKGLQDELSSSMEGAFNLPSTIKPPTVYEVRRALGIDDYLKSMKDATDISAITGASGGGANQMLREIQQGLAANNGSAVPTQSQDYSNSNNNVTINGASFDDVVSWLQQYLGQGAQVVRTVTPRRY